MGGFKVLDMRGEAIGYGGEADNKNIFSDLSLICRDSCNNCKLQSVSYIFLGLWLPIIYFLLIYLFVINALTIS